MRHVAFLAVAVLVAACGTGMAAIVINEIYTDAGGIYDGSEFIELYNNGDDPVDIGGWALAGTEYAQTCGGDLVITKDALDEDGFFVEFPDPPEDLVLLEMHDWGLSYEAPPQPTIVDTMILDINSQSVYDDQILLAGGNGDGVDCGNYEDDMKDVVYLCTGVNCLFYEDLVEYGDSYVCDSDPCPGDDGDGNMYPDMPRMGVSLNRIPDGDDGDNSSLDFVLGRPTPGEANDTNLPPWISTIRYSPIPPSDGVPTEITALVTDDGSVQSVELGYSNDDGDTWNTLPMSVVTGDTYGATIPGQSDGTVVSYYISATDDQDVNIKNPGLGPVEPMQYLVGLTTIYSIQFVTTPLDPGDWGYTPKYGQPVNIQGVVTAGTEVYSSSLVYIQDGGGPWEGVLVYIGGYDGDIETGDLITVCGEASEYYGETEINRHFPESVVVNDHDQTILIADIATNEIPPHARGFSEQWEGQLVRTSDVTVLDPDFGFGMYTISDGGAADTCLVDDRAYYNYTPQANDVLAEVIGVVQYSYDEFKIQPRDDFDIIGPPKITTIRYSPVPPAPGQAVTITAHTYDNAAVTEATLHYRKESEGVWVDVPMGELTREEVEQNWTALISPSADGERISYYVTCTDGTFDARTPSFGDYDLYVGIMTIREVQEVLAGGDQSLLMGLPVNVLGKVSAEPGVYTNYTFYIQDDEGPWNGVRIYDRTSSVAFSRWDSLVVCGSVEEYVAGGILHPETEITLHFPESAVSYGPGQPVAPVVVNTNELLSIEDAEKYEGCRVHVRYGTVYEAQNTYGDWMIQNGGYDPCPVGDWGDYTYVPEVDDEVWLMGIVSPSFDTYKIEPRGDEDIYPFGTDVEEVDRRFALGQNVPNPFNPKTTIAFSLEQREEVTLEIYNAVGQKLATLVDEPLSAGPHRVSWNGITDAGERAASGVYFYRLVAGEDEVSKKMVLLK